MMDQKIQEPDQNLHGFGTGYVCSQLCSVGHPIFEVNTNPNGAYQISAERDDELFSIAILTAHYPDMGSIDRTEC